MGSEGAAEAFGLDLRPWVHLAFQDARLLAEEDLDSGPSEKVVYSEVAALRFDRLPFLDPVSWIPPLSFSALRQSSAVLPAHPRQKQCL